MAGRKGIKAGEAFIAIRAIDQTAAVLQAVGARLSALSAQVQAIGLGLVKLGALIVGPFLLAAKIFANVGDKLGKMSKKIGFSVESLSELEVAAELAGGNIEGFEKSIFKMQDFIEDAGDGLATYTRVLDKLGISMDDLKGKSPDEQFGLIVDSLADLDDIQRRNALATDIFGRGIKGLLPMLDQGAAGIEKLKQEARDRGLVITAEDAKAAEEFTDTMSLLGKVVRIVMFRIGATVAPVIANIAKWFSNLSKGIQDFIKRNEAMFQTIFRFGGIILIAGLALLALAAVIKLAAFAFSALAFVITVVKVVITALVALFTFLVSPIGLIVVALAALTAAFLLFTKQGQAISQIFQKAFGDIVKVAKDTFAGIANALKAGDIELAAKIAWTGLKIIFFTTISALKKAWQEFVNFFQEIWFNATASVAKLITKIVASFQSIGPALSRAAMQGDIDKQEAVIQAQRTEIINRITEVQNKIHEQAGQDVTLGQFEKGKSLEQKHKELGIDTVDPKLFADLDDLGKARDALDAPTLDLIAKSEEAANALLGIANRENDIVKQIEAQRLQDIAGIKSAETSEAEKNELAALMRELKELSNEATVKADKADSFDPKKPREDPAKVVGSLGTLLQSKDIRSVDAHKDAMDNKRNAFLADIVKGIGDTNERLEELAEREGIVGV